MQPDFPLVSAGISNVMIDKSVGPDAFFKGWFVYATNLVTTIPGVQHRLEQAAQSLDLVVVIDTMPAEITGYADVVLPECTYLERYDDLRNKADGLIYSTERTLEEFAENVSEEDREELEKALAATTEAMQSDDGGVLRAAVDELSALTYKMTEALYAELGGDESE